MPLNTMNGFLSDLISQEGCMKWCDCPLQYISPAKTYFSLSFMKKNKHHTAMLIECSLL